MIVFLFGQSGHIMLNEWTVGSATVVFPSFIIVKRNIVKPNSIKLSSHSKLRGIWVFYTCYYDARGAFSTPTDNNKNQEMR